MHFLKKVQLHKKFFAKLKSEQTKNFELKNFFSYSFAIDHAGMNHADRRLSRRSFR